MKVKKGNKVYPLITGNDIIVTKGSQSLKTVDDALDDQQKEIDKLKSNVKYIYSYGGVGGNGSGSGSGSSSESSASFVARLGGHKLEDEGSTIYFSSPGKYSFIVNVRDSGGKTFYVRYAYDGGEKSSPQPLSTELNMCEYSIELTLQKNSNIIVEFLDADGGFLDSITQSYIVNPHIFSLNFKYIYENEEKVFPSDNEYFIGDTVHSNPFVDISYTISINDISNAKITYSIGDTDKVDETDDDHMSGQSSITYGNVTDISDDHIKIYLDKLTRNGEEFIQKSNTGTYTVTATLSYSSQGDTVTETTSFTFSVIPNDLYISVRNPQDVLYNTFNDIIVAKSYGEGGVPEKNITEGSYLSVYCKVFEGEIKSDPHAYSMVCYVYDYIDDGSDGSDGSDDSDIIVYDENNFSTISYTKTFNATEQVESGLISLPCSTSGMKKIVFKAENAKNTGGENNITEKYVYVSEPSSTIDWYPNLEMQSYYFRANCGTDTYSDNFPELKSGVQPLEMKTTDNKAITIKNDAWASISTNNDTTILSLGMQYNQINSDNAQILEIYSENNAAKATLTLYSSHIFTDNDEEISIPYDTDSYSATDVSKYHLVQIVRTKLGENESGEKIYGSYLYIDGVPESAKTSTDNAKLFIGKIILNNINVSYNLINIQYVNNGEYTTDELIYQYYLKYKERIMGETISKSEKTIYNCFNNHSVTFDGTNVKMDLGTVSSIAPDMPIPTMVLKYTNSDETESSTLLDNLFKGYYNGANEAFGEQTISLLWCDGLKENVNTSLSEISVPSIAGALTGHWFVKLQGTSTMKNRIKNFSVGVRTDSTNEYKEQILVSPNYDANDSSTFLPEQVWTIKADIADSAHANNTSIGKFVNTVCTKFQTGQNYSTTASSYIKNTLEGFPVMLYFQINDDVYYFGVYNFNMGRDSYYNLGYYSATDMDDMISNISSSTSGFTFSRGKGVLINTLTIGEIQDNSSQFDFHQFDDSVLFKSNNDNISKMFGTDSDIKYGSTVNTAKTTLSNFVKSVAIAGAYCFGNVGKEAVSAQNTDGGCKDVYSTENNVPDINCQMYYDSAGNITWKNNSDSTDTSIVVDGTNLTLKDITFDKCKNDIDNLLRCIHTTLSDESISNNPYLDYTSASEYYTICMAFGLIDSVLKNMTVKSWNNHKCYICFYDMDCALGEDNSGGETVSYLAATDYWYSKKNTSEILEPVTNNIKWDYWDDTVGKGFDIKSSYLFAIVKYAQALLNNSTDINLTLTHYPQEFWAELRQSTGELRSADYFVNNYFKSGIGSIPAYMAAMNYQVKYLYNGNTLDNNGVEKSSYLANVSAFHGSRVFKVKNWLNKRLHFLDAMFNVQNMNISITSGVYMPTPNETLMDSLRSNTDITVLQDAFSTSTDTSSLTASNTIVNLFGPKNTPVIVVVGETYYIYILSEGIGKANSIIVNVPQSAFTVKCLGSKELTNISNVAPFLTKAYQVVTDKLEYINGDYTSFPSQSASFTIDSASVKEVNMNIPGFTGKLNITSDTIKGQSIKKLNVSGSNFYGEWKSLKNLQELNISSVNVENQSIVVSGSELLTGSNCHISGADEENKTILKSLSMTDVSGNFVLENTEIEKISMTALKYSESSFEINGDSIISELSLTGFNEIKIVNCPRLTTLTITETDSNKCKKIIINVPDNAINENDDNKPYLKSFNYSDKDGIFDFRKYESLETLELTGCLGVETIIMPDHTVTVNSFNNNKNLEFVDTPGYSSVINLINPQTFYMCPCYGMRQSWSSKYTRMSIDSTCTSLAGTFDKGETSASKYLSTPYENIYGTSTKNQSIIIKDARHFLENIVGGLVQDDSYITYSDGEYKFIDPNGPGSGKIYSSNFSSNIVSLNKCFRNQSDISILSPSTIYTFPDMSGYTSLTDIGSMYEGTSISCISSGLLSLPDSNNTNDGPELNWYNFIGTSNITMSIDALKNISYRITNFADLTLKIYDSSDTADDPINILDVFSPRVYEGADGVENEDWIYKDETQTTKYIVNKRAKAFINFSMDSSHYVDYTRLFELCPNVTSLQYFLSSYDFTKATIAGMLNPCKKLTYITDSFNHSGETSVGDLPAIDLYDFFNWEENTTDITALFSSEGDANIIGFRVNKTISYENFKKILTKLGSYQKLTKLSNLFSFCTINDYDSSEIKLSTTLPKVTSVDSLFYNCKGVSNNADAPLNIRRTFFEYLPNVTSMVYTFANVHFLHMLTYDFFCKYTATTNTNVYVYVQGDGYKKASLSTYSYENLITNMSYCFSGAKFISCICWFDPNDSNDLDSENNINDTLKPAKEVVTYNGSSDYDSYYTLEGGVYKEHKIEDPIAISDTKNNFTNYVESVTTVGTFTITNHSLSTDLATFRNGTLEGGVYTTNAFGIYPTYCCLPPDIFHACDYRCNLTNVFADTNIIGVIPQHLVKDCAGGTFSNMLMNTNILPNIMYHYNKTWDNNADYLNLIGNIPTDDSIITSTGDYEIDTENTEATVLFRDSNGVLKRRHPMVEDDGSDSDSNPDIIEYSKSQFVYVPQGFTSNQIIDDSFTFRYNLPKNTNLVKSELASKWGGVTSGNNEYSPEKKPELWPYYVQYFFLSDESLDWSKIESMERPFISNDNDVDFDTNKIRMFSTDQGGTYNLWYQTKESFDKTRWTQLTNGTFNSFLNLCGKRDAVTGALSDYGCPISSAISNGHYVKLDYFVSGILSIFLNGRIFDDTLDAATLSSVNISGGDSIINYTGFGKNIILPQLISLIDEEYDDRVVLGSNVNIEQGTQVQFYKFMFPDTNSLNNYKSRYFGGRDENVIQTTLNNVDIVKYRLS